MHMRKTLIAVTALALAASTSACAGGSGGDDRECLPVSAEVMATLAEGSNEYPITPVAAAAVESKTREGVTVIAMTFTEDADPAEQQVGVWAVGGDLAEYPGIGPWLSIDAIADLYSDYPNEMNGEKFSVTEDGAAEAIACLG